MPEMGMVDDELSSAEVRALDELGQSFKRTLQRRSLTQPQYAALELLAEHQGEWVRAWTKTTTGEQLVPRVNVRAAWALVKKELAYGQLPLQYSGTACGDTFQIRPDGIKLVRQITEEQ